MSLFVGKGSDGKPLLHITKDTRQKVSDINGAPDVNSTFHSSLPYISIVATDEFSYYINTTTQNSIAAGNVGCHRFPLSKAINYQKLVKRGRYGCILQLKRSDGWWFTAGFSSGFHTIGRGTGNMYYCSLDVWYHCGGPRARRFTLNRTVPYIYTSSNVVAVRILIINLDSSGNLIKQTHPGDEIKISGYEFRIGGLDLSKYSYLSSDNHLKGEPLAHSLSMFNYRCDLLPGSLEDKFHGTRNFCSSKGNSLSKSNLDNIVTSIVKPSKSGGWSINPNSIKKGGNKVWDVGEKSKFKYLGKSHFNINYRFTSFNNSDRKTINTRINIPLETSTFLMSENGCMYSPFSCLDRSLDIPLFFNSSSWAINYTIPNPVPKIPDEVIEVPDTVIPAPDPPIFDGKPLYPKGPDRIIHNPPIIIPRDIGWMPFIHVFASIRSGTSIYLSISNNSINFKGHEAHSIDDPKGLAPFRFPIKDFMDDCIYNKRFTMVFLK